MSSACCSGESSAPKEAWMPPCAFDELFAWSEPLRRERDAGARALGGDRGGEPGGAAADHEHVEAAGRLRPQRDNPDHRLLSCS